MLWMDIWVHPYTVILLQMRVNFWKIGVWVQANSIVVSWLRLQTASDCIPIHIICISVLAPWYAIDGHMGAPLHFYICVSGGEFWESWGVDECVVSWLSVKTASEGIPHPYHMYIHSVLAPWYAMDGHMAAPLHCYTGTGGGEFLESVDVDEGKWCCGVMV